MKKLEKVEMRKNKIKFKNVVNGWYNCLLEINDNELIKCCTKVFKNAKK